MCNAFALLLLGIKCRVCGDSPGCKVSVIYYLRMRNCYIAYIGGIIPLIGIRLLYLKKVWHWSYGLPLWLLPCTNKVICKNNSQKFLFLIFHKLHYVLFSKQFLFGIIIFELIHNWFLTIERPFYLLHHTFCNILRKIISQCRRHISIH